MPNFRLIIVFIGKKNTSYKITKNLKFADTQCICDEIPVNLVLLIRSVKKYIQQMVLMKRA